MTDAGTQVFGLDFDNTIAGYDALLHKIASERGLINPDVPCSKDSIRNAVRLPDEGEAEWQRLQALVYGPRIMEAVPNEGAISFFKECKIKGVQTYVVSHKTDFAALDETGTNLKEAALNWLNSNGFFNTDTGLTDTRVYFENTRKEKLKRIAVLGCTHFVDDLPETFLETSFPAGVAKILYSPSNNSTAVPMIRVVQDWAAVSGFLTYRSAVVPEQ